MKKIIICLTSIFLFTVVADTLETSGEVYINGKVATKNTVVKLGDFIKTGKNSKVKFNIGKDAFLAKDNASFSISEKAGLKSLNVVTGGVLAVFEKGGNHEVKTENMTAGIRGPGVSLEQKEGKAYFCTCYGQTHLHTHKEDTLYSATHHNMVWVKDDGSVKPASTKEGHSDDELRELEAMVGRVPEFDK